MSGGHFNYDQNRIGYIADAIDDLIQENNSTEIDRYGSVIGGRYSPATIKRFKEAVVLLRLAQVYAQRIDWLVSCDDGEEQFHKRLGAELESIR